MVCQDSIIRINKDGTPYALGNGFYLHSTLKENLDYEHKRIGKNWDCLGCLCGEEGSGKTNLGKAICYYMSDLSGIRFTVDDIFFTVPQFENWLENAKPGTSGLWDEFVLAGLSTDALLQIQNTLIKKMTMIRKKRLFILLVIPYIFMLRKYFAIARTRFMIQVTSPDNLSRGTFDYYSKPNKRKLYILGYKFWEPNAWDCDFHGNFSDYTGLLVNEEIYEQRKDEATKTLDEKGGLKGNLWYTRVGFACKQLNDYGMTYERLANIFNMNITDVENSIASF